MNTYAIYTSKRELLLPPMHAGSVWEHQQNIRGEDCYDALADFISKRDRQSQAIEYSGLAHSGPAIFAYDAATNFCAVLMPNLHYAVKSLAGQKTTIEGGPGACMYFIGKDGRVEGVK